MLYELKLNDFRLFKNKTINLGKYMTVLSGRNSTGKSTILGLLANCGELKKKDGLCINGKAFRAEFGEIFKAREKYDISLSNRLRLNIIDNSGNEIDYRCFRTSWQTDGIGKRFRIIPYKVKEDGTKSEAKFELPVIYLGLSRLYPIGETDNKIQEENLKNINDKDKKWFEYNYLDILNNHDNILSLDKYNVESTRKNGVATTTDKYDYLTNSAGQDNIGQILLAILSFKKLHETNTNIKEGILLIDELDASLHPAAQKKLLDLLFKESKNNSFQTVFTTHSSDLLKYTSTKIAHNNDGINNIELYYFTNANRQMEIKRNISYSIIEGDLLITSIVQNNNKIKVYTEDEETRWFFESLVQENIQFLNVLDVTIGCEELLHIIKADPEYFSNCLCVFDGDLKHETILNYIPQRILDIQKNILVLPGKDNPEQVLYKYIMGLPPEHPFWENAGRFNLSYDYFCDSGNPNKYDGNHQREKNKKWFRDHRRYFEATKLFDSWKNDNKESVDKFVNSFIESYNTIAQRTFNNKIVK